MPFRPLPKGEWLASPAETLSTETETQAGTPEEPLAQELGWTDEQPDPNSQANQRSETATTETTALRVPPLRTARLRPTCSRRLL